MNREHVQIYLTYSLYLESKFLKIKSYHFLWFYILIVSRCPFHSFNKNLVSSNLWFDLWSLILSYFESKYCVRLWFWYNFLLVMKKTVLQDCVDSILCVTFWLDYNIRTQLIFPCKIQCFYFSNLHVFDLGLFA